MAKKKAAKKSPSKKAPAKKRAKPKVELPPITASVVRGACAAGGAKWKDPRKSARECKASSTDISAFGKVGGKYSAAATGKIYMGRVVK